MRRPPQGRSRSSRAPARSSCASRGIRRKRRRRGAATANGHKLLTQFPDCARALAKYRINPGNVGKGAKRDDQFATMIECAVRYGKPVRIGVNWGSLDPALLARMMD